ncbi:MAG: thiol reductant ABC exporter subunit CydD [Methylobacteriaceae bacterium]|jgi:ATP-binding cassette subfamily C protein CydD|nr:thiol reductant ABC exporter subunit CydD [Methylobacteriaceae bacterium]
MTAMETTPLSLSQPEKTRSLAPSCVMTTLASLLWLPQAWLIASVVGALATGGYTSVRESFVLEFGGVLGLGLLRAGLTAAASRSAFLFARQGVHAARGTAVAVLARASPVDLNRPTSGLAASVVTEQAEMLIPYHARYKPAQIKAGIVPALILLAILPFSWVAALALLIAMPVVPLFMALIGWQAQKASEEQLGRMSDMNAFLLDRLRGLATIRALDAVDRTAVRLRAGAESLRMRTMRVLRIAFLTSAVLELFSALGVAMVAVYVGFHLLGELNFGAWGGRLTLGEGMFILLLSPAFFEPLRELSAVWHDRAAGKAAQEAMRALTRPGLTLPGADEAAAGTGRGSGSGRAPEIVLETLVFRHSAEAPAVFDGFSCTVRSGEHVALFGPSGQGKTTLLALVAGLVPVSSGEIRFDGVSMTGENAETLRSQIGWLGQRSHIFATTINRNITLGRLSLGKPEIEKALTVASLGEVAARRGGAPLGEGGNGLSGGEALRLLLARAAADENVSVILADEPTAHLDAETARDITEDLLRLAAGKTMLVATHDPELAARMDRVIRLNEESGEGAQ